MASPHLAIPGLTTRDLSIAERRPGFFYHDRSRAPGFTLQRVTLLHGDIGGVEGESTLDDVRVEPWQLVGGLHEGFRIALLGVSLGRVYNAARAVGLARWAIERAVAYAGQRIAFGMPIAEHQGVSFPLADSAMQVHAAHLMGL